MPPIRRLLLGVGLLSVALLASGPSPASGASEEQHTVLPVAVTVDVLSRFAEQNIILTGWIEVTSSAPRIENGASVFDLQVDRVHLQGASQLGLITAAERPDDNGRYISRGEVRALQAGQQFPASSYIDLYADIAAPVSPIGPLAFHNEAALHLVPWKDDAEASLSAWPPFGATYRLAPLAEGPGCVPLLNPDNTSLPLDVCVADLSIQLAPEPLSFSVARGGPSRLHPADILGLVPNAGDTTTAQAPFVRIPCASLGLTADGCDDGADGTQDDVDGLSYGQDLSGGSSFAFSVGSGALGAPGSAVEAQDQCPPAAPGLAPEAESDIFTTSLDGSNELLFDGNGPIGSCTVGFPLGLIEAATARDNVDAIDARDASAVDADGNGVPEQPVYFSLAAGSPSLAALGFSAGDILVTSNGETPTLFASAQQLGLGPDDDLDAFCLRENGDRTYDSEDVVYYSVAPRLTGTTPNGVQPGDILAPGTPPVIVRRASQLGLAASDDIDALECGMLIASDTQSGDVTCDSVTNAIDALLVLQLNAHLLSALPCPQNGDVNSDRQINGLDATLILQFSAGLIGQL